MPSVEVKSRRVGGSTYQVPMEVRHKGGVTGNSLVNTTCKCQKWLVDACEAGK
ncbi:MAG: hypothetical protein Ct9H300mP28_25110 [Pseudomonadota bacterium]|nr:MAG: hypothetical protein Ct9H300mP28_25110 [Pseudomonadota bacterium]